MFKATKRAFGFYNSFFRSTVSAIHTTIPKAIGKKQNLIIPIVGGVFGIALCCKNNIAYLDLGEYNFFPQYKGKDDAYHWLKYYFRHSDLALVEEAVQIVLENFNYLSLKEEEPQFVEGLLVGLFKAHEDVIQYWITKFEPILTGTEEKHMLYRAIRQSGSKYGQEYLQNIKKTASEDEIEYINDILKLPIMDLRESDYLTHKTIVIYLQTLRGMYAISGNEQIIQHIAHLAGWWRKDTLNDELNLEKFYMGMKACNTLVLMSEDYDNVKISLHNYAPLFDEQTKKFLHIIN